MRHASTIRPQAGRRPLAAAVAVAVLASVPVAAVDVADVAAKTTGTRPKRRETT